MDIKKENKYNLIKIPLFIENKIYINIFQYKNNTTLRETINSKRYSKFSKEVNLKYKNFLETWIWIFLINLKNINNSFYKKFLNKNWDLKYTKFYIKENLEKKWIYIYTVNNKLKYIGRCNDNMKKRINNWYWKISPKNCFLDWQSTNCKLNSFINQNKNSELFLFDMSNEKKEQIDLYEEELIQKYNPEWNTIKFNS